MTCNCRDPVDQWIAESSESIAKRAVRELEALVGVSTPSGDVAGAQEAEAIAVALLPDAAEVEHVPCSSPDHAPDLVARLRGTGTGRILLLGHLDTVVAHGEHRPLTPDPDHADRLLGSGAAARPLRRGRPAARRRRGVARRPVRPRRALRRVRRLPLLRGGGADGERR